MTACSQSNPRLRKIQLLQLGYCITFLRSYSLPFLPRSALGLIIIDRFWASTTGIARGKRIRAVCVRRENTPWRGWFEFFPLSPFGPQGKHSATAAARDLCTGVAATHSSAERVRHRHGAKGACTFCLYSVYFLSKADFFAALKTLRRATTHAATPVSSKETVVLSARPSRRKHNTL